MVSSAKSASEKKEIGKRIYELRCSLNESQEGMARRIGVSLLSYRHYEKGRSFPGGAKLLKLQALGLDRQTTRNNTNPASASAQLHAALDIILERAPESITTKVAENLTRYAGIYGAR